MPVPTDTLWNIKRLNRWFAFSCVLLVITFGWSVYQDYAKTWRDLQMEAKVWDAALVTARMEEREEESNQKRREAIENRIAALEARFGKPMTATTPEVPGNDAQHEADKKRMRELFSAINNTELRLNNEKALVAKNEVLLQEARTAQDEERVKKVKAELDKQAANVNQWNEQVAQWKMEEAALREVVNKRAAELTQLYKERKALEDELEALAKKREQAVPQSVLGKLGVTMRRIPLLQFMNPSEKVRQIVMPDVQMDLSFVTTEVINRCTTCHVNIADKDYTREKVVAFMEKELARDRGIRLAGMPPARADEPQAWRSRPGGVALAEFWHYWGWELKPADAVKANGPRASVLAKTVAAKRTPAQPVQVTYGSEVVEAFDYKPDEKDAAARDRQDAILGAILNLWLRVDRPADPKAAVFIRDAVEQRSPDGKAKAIIQGSVDPATMGRARAAALGYVETFERTILDQLEKEARRAFEEKYRYALVNALNESDKRSERRREKLSASPVFLAHPRLELYAHEDSPHRMDRVGCTTCHEGSGMETDFVLAAHAANEMWVDDKTGEPVFANQLLKRPKAHHEVTMASMLKAAWPEEALLPTGVSGVHLKLGGGGHNGHGAANGAKPENGTAEARLVVDTGAGNPAAKPDSAQAHSPADRPRAKGFGEGLLGAPGHGDESIEYVDKASGRRGRAVSQLHHWSSKYERESGTTFHLVSEFWEFPMRPRHHVEANCARCHVNITEVAADAPTLHQGRTLFAKLGCVNCHQMDSIPADEPDEPFSGDKKRVGTDLRNINAKLSPEFINSWIWAPKSFRPSTLMPHFFMLENNSSDEEIRRTRLEARAMTEYLLATSNRYPQPGPNGKPQLGADGKPVLGPWQPRHKPASGVAGDAEKGKELFNTLGCMACHTNLSDKNEDDVARAQQWIVRDLIRSGGLSEEDAVAAYEGMTYNQKQWYVLQNFGALTSVGQAKYYPPMDDDEKTNPKVRPIFMHHGPELSGIGDKLLAGRTPEQAKGWLFDWLKEPRHYSSYTVMPSLRLSDQEAAHLVEYLLGQRRKNLDEKDTWKAELFPVDQVKLKEVVAWFLRSQYTPALADKAAADPEEMRKRAVDALTSPSILEKDQAEAAAKEMDLSRRQLLFVGKKLVAHYGCFNCHAINGMEGQASPCANLSDWGQKMVTRLAYEFLDPHKVHDFHERGVHANVPMVNGLAAEASHIGSAPGGAGTPNVAQPVKVAWPTLEHTRESWLGQKLLNTRVYDRGKNLLEPVRASDPKTPLPLDGRGRPYDKLKMPTFYLNDAQVRSLVTFVISNRNRLITAKLLNESNTEHSKRLAIGRQVAERLNCVSCHHVDGNYPAIHQYYEAVKQEDMSKFWMMAPPDLHHEGNRIQHAWLFNFLKNVEPLRPMVQPRMPSFPITDQESEALAAYFNAISQRESRWLKKRLESIEKVVAEKKKASTRPATNPSEPWPGDDWYKPVVTLAPPPPGAQPVKDPFADTLIERKLREQFNERQIREMVRQWEREGPPPVGRTVVLDQAVKDLVTWGVTNRLPQMTYTNLDANKTKGLELDKVFRSLLFEARFLASVTDAPYPLVDSPRPDVSDAMFARGQQFFYDLDCMKCHVLGDPKVTAAFKIEQPTQGPNLGMAHRRLQWRWVAHWVQQTNLILPVGSPMPPFFDGLPAWKLEGLVFGQDAPTIEEMAPDKRKTVQAHMAKYGATAAEQKDLLLSFVYAAGVRNHTVKPPPATQPSATQPAARPAGQAQPAAKPGG